MINNVYCYTLQVKTAKLVAILDIGFFGFVFAATTFAIAGLDMKITIIGLICACFNVFMYGSPLAAVVNSFRHPQIN
jgi:solute carrier family 50 protein (sugar transporter)